MMHARKAACLVAIAMAAGLAACTPPNQVDSDKKVDTATSQSPRSLPTYMNCGQAVTQPTRLVVACETRDETIEGITWEQWDEKGARGAAGSTQIVLGEPTVVDGALQFTTITVDGVTVFPERS